jgi:DNA-directed RNA polymerase subunit RPC12/RpoP
VQEGKRIIKCENCSYEWEYKGKLALATCPNCGHKNKVEEEKKTK